MVASITEVTRYMNKIEVFQVLLPLALVFCAAKFFGLCARKLQMPQVVGEIIAGLILGPCVLGVIDLSNPSYGLSIKTIAEIGVIFLMFSAGLGTNLKDLLKVGPTALLVAAAGVAVPVCAGTGVYYLFGFNNGHQFFEALFTGTILAATSVSITVQALKELGYLQSKVGTTIVSAAVIDDVIGIVLLTVVSSLSNSGNSDLTGLGLVLLRILIFFALVIGIGIVIYFAFKWLEKRRPHTRTLPIMAMAMCFILAYIAEVYFDIADIIGAYSAGIILCQLKNAEYIQRKIDVCSYMFFGPVFFASVGLKTSLSGMTLPLLIFAVVLTLVALGSKVVGCGAVAKLCKFSTTDSLKIGVGMMTRGEVALIITDKGIAAKVIDKSMNIAVVPLIIVASLATPILLKVLYTKWPDNKVKGRNDSHSDKDHITYPEMFQEKKGDSLTIEIK